MQSSVNSALASEDRAPRAGYLARVPDLATYDTIDIDINVDTNLV